MIILKISLLLLVVAIARLHAQEDYVIKAAPVTEWGYYRPWIRCPEHNYIKGFQLKTEPDQGYGDDSALNNIKFACTSS